MDRESAIAEVLTGLTEGMSLQAVLDTIQAPFTESAFRRWVVEDVYGLRARYRTARALGSESRIDYVWDQLDRATRDDVPRLRAMMQAAQWGAERRNPKDFAPRHVQVAEDDQGNQQSVMVVAMPVKRINNSEDG